jgi:tetratricopeptide (TPR) repeat protein
MNLIYESKGNFDIDMSSQCLLLFSSDFRACIQFLECLFYKVVYRPIGGSDCRVWIMNQRKRKMLQRYKKSMGKMLEALVNLKTVLELKVRILGRDNKELGTAYANLAEAYMVALNYNDALPLCLKSLDFQISEFGANSLGMARYCNGTIRTGNRTR